MPHPSLFVRGSTAVWNLCKRHHVTACVAAGLLLCLPAIGPALFLDDYVLGLIAHGEPRLPGLAQGTFDLFSFALGEPRPNRALIDQGLLLPWWSDPDLKIVFFRPLSSLSHRLDFAAWPRAPELMYIHSLFWLSAAIAAVARLYRGFAQTEAEGIVAGLLFAVNDANGAAVNWISNRSVIIGMLFGVLALTAHHRARRSGRLWSVAAPLWTTAGLAAGEVGLWSFAYLLAYALVLDKDTVGRRAASFCPYAVTLVVWQIAYAASNAGSHASGVYLHPWYSLPDFLDAFTSRAVALLSSVWGLIPSDASFLAPSEHLRSIFVAGLATCVAAAAVAYRHLLEDRMLRFWALGMVVSLVPVTASFPSDRLILPANLGAMALVARFACVAFRPHRYPRAGRLRRLGGLLFVAVHGVVSPLLLPIRAHNVQQLTGAMSRSIACLDEIQDLERKTLIFLGGPADFWISYLQAERSWKGLHRPKEMVWLRSSTSALLVHGSEQAMTFEQSDKSVAPGFFRSFPERLYRDDGAPFSSGQRFELPSLDAVVETVTPTGAPLRIAFEFLEPLASGRYEVLVWEGDRYQVTSAEALLGEHRVPVAHIAETLLNR